MSQTMQEKLAEIWWERNKAKHTPYAWTGNSQYVNVVAILADFADEFRIVDINDVLIELEHRA